MSATMKFSPRLNISSSLSRMAIHDKRDRLNTEYAATGSFCKQSVAKKQAVDEIAHSKCTCFIQRAEAIIENVIKNHVYVFDARTSFIVDSFNRPSIEMVH